MIQKSSKAYIYDSKIQNSPKLHDFRIGKHISHLTVWIDHLDFKNRKTTWLHGRLGTIDCILAYLSLSLSLSLYIYIYIFIRLIGKFISLHWFNLMYTLCRIID